MTGLIQQVAGTAFSPGNSLIPVLPAVPVGATTALWCYPGTDLAHSQNLMGAPAITAIGTPTYQSSYVSCTPGASPSVLNTGIPDDAAGRSLSVLWAARNTGTLDGQFATPIANQDASTSFGIDVRLVGIGTYQVTVNGPGITATLNILNPGTWHIMGFAYDDTAPRTLYLFNLTDSLQGTFTNTNNSRVLSATSPWWIGANPRAGGNWATRTCDVGFAGMIKGQVINYATAQQYAANIRANALARGLILP